jgi:hypothetical protein
MIESLARFPEFCFAFIVKKNDVKMRLGVEQRPKGAIRL